MFGVKRHLRICLSPRRTRRIVTVSRSFNVPTRVMKHVRTYRRARLVVGDRFKRFECWEVTSGDAVLRGLSKLMTHFRRVSALVASPTIVTSRGHCIGLAGRCGRLSSLVGTHGRCVRLLNGVRRTEGVLTGRSSTSVHRVTGRRVSDDRRHLPMLRRRVGLVLIPTSPRSDGGTVLRVHNNAKNSRTTVFTNSLFHVCTGCYRAGN